MSGYRYQVVEDAGRWIGKVWSDAGLVYETPMHDDRFAAQVDLDVWRDERTDPGLADAERHAVDAGAAVRKARREGEGA